MATESVEGAPTRAPEQAPVPSAVRAALTLGLYTGGLLLATRATILYVLGHRERGEEASAVLWRLSHDLPLAAVHALAAGALAVALAFGAARRRRWNPLRAVALLAAAAALLSVLSGWPLDEPFNVPSLATERGRLALGVLSVASVAGAGLLLRVARAASPPGKPLGRALGSRPALLGGVALALLAPLVFGLSFGRLPPTRTVRLRALEVAFEPELWRITRAHPERRTELGVVTPSLDYRVDGGDQPALVMPPPAEVRFIVPDEPEGMFLRASAGADHRPDRRLANQGSSVVVGFEIQVDGRTVLQESVLLGAGREKDLVWSRLPARGVPVSPGAEVVLRTTIEKPRGAAADELPLVEAGFGELVLEYEVERPRARATPDAPNVLLIVMDTLRADRMSCYGYHKPTTPNVDALAARGMLFEEAYATSSWTWPATASILTGLIPEAHQVTHDGSCYLDGKIVTLPEVLGERGYTTAAFTCNPLIVPDKNFDQGFERFDSHSSFRKTNLVIDPVRAWLRMHRNDRFFLYLHLVDPHWSYEPLPESRELAGLGPPPPGFPPRGIVDYHQMLLRGEGHGPSGELRTEEVVPLSHREHMDREYDAAVHTSDHYVGRILATLTRLGLDDRTVIVFTSDHGEEILDHGLVTHGISLYREVTRVPLILAGPSIPAGRRVDTYVSNRHLAPTIAMLAGAEMPPFEVDPEHPSPFEDHPRAGAPIVLLDPDAIPEEPIFFSTHQGWWKGRSHLELYGMIEGEWEVHFAPNGRPWGAEETPPEGDFALYHLPTDPHQHDDLSLSSPEHRERAQAMIERMAKHHDRARAAGRDVRLGAGRAALDYLMGLGYLGMDPARAEESER